MPYRKVQIECRNAGLASGGASGVLRKRLLAWVQEEQKATAAEDGEPSPKRQKKSPADDLVCSITKELPFVPVMAEDGRIYEKNAIQQHFNTKTKASQVIKSPITHEPMGTRLLPAIQTKNLIETLIANGNITGELAENWLQLAKEKKEMEDMIKKAEEGDVEMMIRVGRCYRDGSNGFTQDKVKSYGWFEKASVAGSVVAMACVGGVLMCGTGVTKDKKTGMAYLGIAAGRGSDLAAYLMGKVFAKGHHGLSANKAEAKRLLQQCLSPLCRYKHMAMDFRTKAQALLDELNRSPPTTIIVSANVPQSSPPSDDVSVLSMSHFP